MSRLNKTKQNLVLSLLETKNFTLPDFEIAFPDQGEVYVSITFKHDKKYFFLVSEEYSSLAIVATISKGTDVRGKPRTHESPGEFKAKQIHSCESFDDCIHRIPIWCGNLYAELRAGNSEQEQITSLQEELEARFQQQINDPESRFSNEELERLHQHLDSLTERIKKMEQDHSITKAQLNEITTGIDGIKGNAASLPKGIWAGITKNRLISILTKIATSPEGRKFALEAAEKFILGIKN